MKYPILLLIFVMLFSCGVDNRKEAENIITEFEKENIADKRETVFEVEPYFEKGNVVLRGEISNPQKKQELSDAFGSLQFRDEITLLPDSTVGEKTFALVNISVANLRAEPRHSAELITQALLGTPVKVLKKENGWYMIQTPDNYISWVDPSGITPVTEAELQNWQQSERMIFTEDFAEVFRDQRFEEPISDISMGNILEVTSQNWRQVELRFPDGRTGFTANSGWEDFDTFKNETQPDTTNIINLARQFTGRPYLWGGTSSRAMDCSGFSKTVYFMNGVILARDASLQIKHGQLVEADPSFSQFQPGDLLFFGRLNPDSTQRITHVAISTGGTEFIHASGRIKENSFNPASDIYSEYRRESFMRARRITGEEGTGGIRRINEHPWY
ncbi:MAG: NlpC/P60 family protein [Tangfeifania sp.]